ncbi:MAG TPA: DsbA family oxidoreductase [Acidothermaceae bacterium]|jgi:predicted DsbA family dithiol-disulfide isomerase
MKVEIWSDVVCPWCYVGKRRFETALAQFEHRAEVDVHWRAFELDPGAPAVREGDPVQGLADKYGMSRAQALAANARLTDMAAAEGLEFHLDTARGGNTFDAHRLIHLAGEKGVQDAVKERFMLGYFTQNEPVGDAETLTRLAVEAGLDETDVKAVLTSDQYANDVVADEQQAAAYGISGVPFFVVDGKYGVSGAQSPEVLLQTLRTAHAEANPLTMVTTAGDAACEGDSCAI